MTVIAALALAATLIWPAYALCRSFQSIAGYRTIAEPVDVEPELEPAPWPTRLTPTDLAAAYEPAPVVERRVSWVMPDDEEFEAHLAALRADYAASIRAFRWATGELERIRVDVRDEMVVAA